MACFKRNQWPNRVDRHRMITAMALTVKKLHDAGIIHNALYGRHLYINVIPHDDGTVTIPDELQCCFIDLERAKYPGVHSPKMVSRDLRVMNKNSTEWPSRDKILFIKTYLGIDHLSPKAKEIIHQLIKATD